MGVGRVHGGNKQCVKIKVDYREVQLLPLIGREVPRSSGGDKMEGEGGRDFGEGEKCMW